MEQHKQYKAANFDTFKNFEKYEQKLEQHKQYKTTNYDTFKNSEKYRKKLDANKKYINNDRKRKMLTLKTSDERIDSFKIQITNGPYYICVVCNRCLYRRSVKYFVEEKYNMPQENYFFVAHINSFDQKEYICTTCDGKLKKSEVPCQAVCNKLQVVNFPPFIPKLKRLEKIIIAKRLLFKKIAIMPKGQSPKLKGAVCNVPVETESVCNILPRGC